MQRSDLRPDLRAAVAERVVVLDGATGTGLQLLDLSLSDFDGLEGCNEILNVSRPDAVAALHESYFEAGADAVLTNTFGASSITLGEYDLSERTREINRQSALIAGDVADRFSTAERPAIRAWFARSGHQVAFAGPRRIR